MIAAISLNDSGRADPEGSGGRDSGESTGGSVKGGPAIRKVRYADSAEAGVSGR